MNRKEFTNLLLEWRKNFIHERGSNIEFHKDQNQTGYLINPSSSEISGIESYIRDYIKDNSLSSLSDVANQEYFDNGVVLPKTKEVIKMISDFFLEMSNNQTKSKEILSTAGDDECVIVHFTEGDFTLDSNRQSREEIYHWTIHDLEHSLISSITAADFYISDAALRNTEIGKLAKSNYINMYDVLEAQTPNVERTGKLVKRFFEAINFTPEAGLDDLNASAMSYCYIKMKSANDVEEILSLSEEKFSKEEKQQLADIFTQCYHITHASFNDVKEKLKGCLVIVFSL